MRGYAKDLAPYSIRGEHGPPDWGAHHDARERDHGEAHREGPRPDQGHGECAARGRGRPRRHQQRRPVPGRRLRPVREGSAGAPGAVRNGGNAIRRARTIAAQALGIGQGALDYAIGYVKQREQFGRAIADFQGVQFMLADMAMKLEAARQFTYHAAMLSERAMQGEKVPNLTFASAAAKCSASDAAMAITTDAVQLLGGYGSSGTSPSNG
jgi:hypothetical protein